MCFSAHASFIVSSVLVTTGLFSLLKARTRGFRLLALGPILLGLQQALEGIVWLCLNQGDTISVWFKVGTYGFQFFAAAFWPLWIPFVLYVMEPHARYKGILALFTAIGLGMFLILTIALWNNPATAVVVNHHIRYPFLTNPLHHMLPLLPTWQMAIIRYTALAIYTLLVIGSCFVSTAPGMYILGALLLVGYILATLVYSLAFASVWCFFSAVASAAILGIIIYNNRLHKHV